MLKHRSFPLGTSLSHRVHLTSLARVGQVTRQATRRTLIVQAKSSAERRAKRQARQALEEKWKEEREWEEATQKKDVWYEVRRGGIWVEHRRRPEEKQQYLAEKQQQQPLAKYKPSMLELLEASHSAKQLNSRGPGPHTTQHPASSPAPPPRGQPVKPSANQLPHQSSAWTRDPATHTRAQHGGSSRQQQQPQQQQQQQQQHAPRNSQPHARVGHGTRHTPTSPSAAGAPSGRHSASSSPETSTSQLPRDRCIVAAIDGQVSGPAPVNAASKTSVNRHAATVQESTLTASGRQSIAKGSIHGISASTSTDNTNNAEHQRAGSSTLVKGPSPGASGAAAHTGTLPVAQQVSAGPVPPAVTAAEPAAEEPSNIELHEPTTDSHGHGAVPVAPVNTSPSTTAPRRARGYIRQPNK